MTAIKLSDKKKCFCGKIHFNRMFCSVECEYEFKERRRRKRKMNKIKENTEHMGITEDNIKKLESWFSYEELFPIKRKSRKGMPTHIRKYVINKHKGTCSDCGGRERLEIHHEIPYSECKSHEAANLTLLCIKCHYKRHEGDKRIENLFKMRMGQNHE